MSEVRMRAAAGVYNTNLYAFAILCVTCARDGVPPSVPVCRSGGYGGASRS